MLLDDTEINLTEVRDGNTSSLLDLFAYERRAQLVPIRDESVKISEQETKKLMLVVREITTALMWMIYISTGGPYRFTDMVIFKYAGNERNIFFNNNSRCMELDTTYSKSQYINRMCKVLDSNTSAYVLYFMVIVKYMHMKILGSGYNKMTRNLLKEFDKEGDTAWADLARVDIFNEGRLMTGEQFSNQVLHSFLFINSVQHCLLSRSHFTKFIPKYPLKENQKVDKFSRMRDCMVGMMRTYINCDEDFVAQRESMAGHSAESGMFNYATNETGHNGSLTNYKSEQISIMWHKWIGLEEFHLKSAFTKRESLVQKFNVPLKREMQHLHFTQKVLKDTLDGMLMPSQFEAERELFENNANEKINIYMADSTIQLFETNDEHTGGHFYLQPLQAAHMYGATKRIVSFVFVKDTACLGRVSKLLQLYGCRKLGLVSQLLTPGVVVEEGSFNADVYFGTTVDLHSEAIWELLFTWYSKMKLLSLGYLVFHNIDMMKLPKVNDIMPFEYAHRLIIAHDHQRTMNQFRCSLEFLKIDKTPTYDMALSGNEWTNVAKLTTDLPLRNVYKH